MATNPRSLRPRGLSSVRTLFDSEIDSDLRYDTWVMQTIWGRLSTNQLKDVGFKGRLVRIVGRLWCFHNHSCEPNAAFGRMLTAAGNDRRASVSIAYTVSPIKKGEEVLHFVWKHNRPEPVLEAEFSAKMAPRRL